MVNKIYRKKIWKMVNNCNYNIMINIDFSIYDIIVMQLLLCSTSRTRSDRQRTIISLIISHAYGHINRKFLLRNISQFSYK